MNIHFHMLFVDGVYSRNRYGKVTFHRTKAPDKEELTQLVNTISHRVARYLERQGLLERDEENSYLQLDGMEEYPMQQLLGHSITYRVAMGASQGKKVFTLQTVPSKPGDGNDQAAKVAGFSLHAGVVAQHWERKKLERLGRYITRPAVSENRLSVTPAGNVRYQLKTPYRESWPHERGPAHERSECFGCSECSAWPTKCFGHWVRYNSRRIRTDGLFIETGCPGPARSDRSRE